MNKQNQKIVRCIGSVTKGMPLLTALTAVAFDIAVFMWITDSVALQIALGFVIASLTAVGWIMVKGEDYMEDDDDALTYDAGFVGVIATFNYALATWSAAGSGNEHVGRSAAVWMILLIVALIVQAVLLPCAKKLADADDS